MTEKDRWRIAYARSRNCLESAGTWGFGGGIVAMLASSAARELYGVWWSLLVFGIAGVAATLVLGRHEKKLTLELVGDPPDQPEHERIY